MLIDAAATLHPHLNELTIVAPERLGRQELTPSERSRLEALKPLLGYLDYELTFDTRNTETLLHGSGVVFPTTDRQYLTQLVEYAGSQGYLRSSHASHAAQA